VPTRYRVQFSLTLAELALIDNWRFEHREPSRVAAIRRLLRLGLQSKAKGNVDRPKRPRTSACWTRLTKPPGNENRHNSAARREMRRLRIITLLVSSLLLPADAAGTSSADATRQGSNAKAIARSEPSRDIDQRMKECMAMWEPRTHMTKQQWRRTCKTLLVDPP
jgi:hypothetical protein